MDSLSRFWATNAILLGVWESLAVTTKIVPTISNTAARSRKRWPTGTLAVLCTWAAGLVTYLYTKQSESP